MSKHAVLVIIFLLTLMLTGGINAQDQATIPDVTGLSVPEAAALLNRSGFVLGAENNVAWTAESGLNPGAVSGQSLAAGSAAARATTIDLTVLRSPNTLLLYDDNDITLVNNTQAEINLGGITFAALDGPGASFSAARWASSLRPAQCLQLWSVGRNGPKGLPECESIQNWLISANNTSEHFWTSGASQFGVYQDGVQRATCQAAALRCEFYLASATTGDVAEYVYFSYTPNNLVVRNQSANQWMSLNGLVILNNFVQPAGAPISIGDPALYGNGIGLGSVQRLAPGQCIFFTDSSPSAGQLPESCDVVARLDIGTNLIFWGAPFGVDSVSSDLQHSCPAATAGKLTICAMPR